MLPSTAYIIMICKIFPQRLCCACGRAMRSCRSWVWSMSAAMWEWSKYMILLQTQMTAGRWPATCRMHLTPMCLQTAQRHAWVSHFRACLVAETCPHKCLLQLLGVLVVLLTAVKPRCEFSKKIEYLCLHAMRLTMLDMS